MRFFSDNAAPVHPKVMAAMAAADDVDTAYDGDRLSKQMDAAFSTLFNRDVRAIWVTTGTAANSLALAALCPPFGAILCHEEAHIEEDECGAPGFFTHGAKLATCPGAGGKLTPDAVATRIARMRGDVHQEPLRALSITNATEAGRIYTPGDVAALGEIARRHKLGFHMDGARFANAVATLGCAPADVTWKAGIDILSFGFVKNGGMSSEALIFFDPALADETLFRRKRAGHLLSKGRYMAAQVLAMLKDDLWLENARAANAAAQVIARSAGSRLLQPVEANEVFVRLTQAEATKLRAQGFDFYDWGPDQARLVTSWQHGEADVRPIADAIAML